MTQLVMERHVVNEIDMPTKHSPSTPKDALEPSSTAKEDTHDAKQVVGIRQNGARREDSPQSHIALGTSSMASARGASGEGKAESAQGARGKAAAGTPGRIGSESHGNAKPGKSDAEPSGTETKADTETQSGRSVSAEAKRAVTSAMENHGHAVLYGTIGFVAAALILIVGFWPTVLLALFAAVGVAIGMYRDGDRAARERVSSVLKRLT